ncbi:MULTISPECIES: DUF5719 family protein [unclassified Streptomyces]|uniref:DUF5719 family protein n=1 Tax=unclassified Streptomyces TaxID=2593676 RepID=UPI0016609F05|nr:MULTISPECIES: DUF5719 family protein [unclassified Streptomyces]MBD0708670.1 hypothetical protein [Streptomyces sp. CBMA291]MBD0718220.1 hypothetical protein [Streptomyces sp. CBMA370]
MKRTTLSLIAVATALAAVTGFASLTAPGAAPVPEAKAATRLPVQRAGLVCPVPSTSEVAETLYTSYTPPGTGTAAGATGAAKAEPSAARLRPAASQAADGAGKTGKKPKAPKLPATVTAPGKPVAAQVDGAGVPALVGSATGTLAPGWTVQQTTVVSAGGARGLRGLGCGGPDTDFWFPAASTGKDRQDYVHLTNPDDTAAVADIQLFGPKGALKSQFTEGIPVPAHSTVPVLLSTLTAEAPQQDVAVHVTTRSGRVGAAIAAADEKLGGDWLPPAADPATTAVLPGIPADATSVRLVAFVPGEDDADLKVQLATATGTIVPAGSDGLHVKSGMTAFIDLPGLTRGQTGSLVLTPSDPKKATPFVAALQVVRGKEGKTEIAFLPATAPVTARATVADNRAKASTLALTAVGADARVKVTASAGSGGGTPVSKEVAVKAGTTTALVDLVPGGLKGSYALTVEPVSGGKVHASRMLALPLDGIPMFTIQPFVDDRGTVEVPAARQDLGVLD